MNHSNTIVQEICLFRTQVLYLHRCETLHDTILSPFWLSALHKQDGQYASLLHRGPTSRRLSCSLSLLNIETVREKNDYRFTDAFLVSPKFKFPTLTLIDILKLMMDSFSAIISFIMLFASFSSSAQYLLIVEAIQYLQ